MKYADKIGAEYAVVLGDSEVENERAVLKSMKGDFSEELSFEEIAARLG